MQGKTEPPEGWPPPEGWHAPADSEEAAEMLRRLRNPPKYEEATPEEIEFFRSGGKRWPPKDQGPVGYGPTPLSGHREIPLRKLAVVAEDRRARLVAHAL